ADVRGYVRDGPRLISSQSGMRRRHLIEIEDQRWCPAGVRDAATDYLRFVLGKLRPYSAIGPRLRTAMERSGTRQALDLCSGGGGPWEGLAGQLDGVAVRLTDRYPNRAAFERAREASGSRVDFHPAPVDATSVPAELDGFRTLFNAFHHFSPEQA